MNNKILLSSIVAAVSLGVSGLSIASDDPSLVRDQNSSHPYFGIQAGAGSTWDSSNVKGVVRAFGGYLVNKESLGYGLELGGMVLPYDVKEEGFYAVHLFDLLGVAKYNVNKDWSIIGKVGGMYNGGINTYKILPEASIGVGYNINKNVGVDLTYNHLFKIDSDSDNTGIAMLGVKYSFGN